MIENLEKKLNGELPILRSDLFQLVDSWGRFDYINSAYYVKKEECYDLSKLDVSNIKNLSHLFYNSEFNGDISNWNVSNVNDMNYMFSNSKFDNDISSWQFNKNVSCYNTFNQNKNFENKYNDGNEIPINTKIFMKWFEENREKIKGINISKEEILDFFSFPCFSEQVM